MRPLSGPALLSIGLALSAVTCRRTPTFSEPVVDRSNGAIPDLTAPHLAADAITIDGELDDPGWKSAQSTGMFVDPGSGRPAPRSKVNAWAKLAWTDEKLFVAFLVHDASPATPFGPGVVDPHIWASASGVELMIQPGNPGDNRGYFEIQIDASGAIWDTRFDDYNRPVTGGPSDEQKRFGHQDWQAAAARAVGRASDHYTVELSIPWSVLETPRARTPPEPGAAWRVNLYSFRDGQSEALAWSPLLGQGNFHRASRFGRVVFAR